MTFRHAMVLGMAALGIGLADPAGAATFQSLYSFQGSNGDQPYGKLVMDGAGVLYGVTIGGGDSGYGAIYSFDPATARLTTLYSFTGGKDGGTPASGLALGGANLYGAAERGGTSNDGTVFRFNLTSGKFSVLHSFVGGTDGNLPIGALLLRGGVLYGTTAYGGTQAGCPQQGCGTVFSLVPSTKVLTPRHEFSTSDGIVPAAKLLATSSGLLYGTTEGGGPNQHGTVFTIDPGTSAFGTVYGFGGADGASPEADLAIRNGLVYGTTNSGGASANGYGTIFRLDPATGVVTSLYSFMDGTDGIRPTYGVVPGPHALLYGATTQGGGSGAGTLFTFNPSTDVLTTVHDFAIGDGSMPSGPLLLAHGALYGVTSEGGRGFGTIFKLVP